MSIALQNQNAPFIKFFVLLKVKYIYTEKYNFKNFKIEQRVKQGFGAVLF